MSSIKERRYKPRLYVSINLLVGVRQPSCATPLLLLCICARKQAASPASHEKINSWVSFAFLFGYEGLLRYDLGVNPIQA